jgi:hypothetical protein
MVSTDQNYLEDLESLLASWRRHLRARNFSPKTITAYLSTAERFLDFLRAAGMPTSTTGSIENTSRPTLRTSSSGTGPPLPPPATAI